MSNNSINKERFRTSRNDKGVILITTSNKKFRHNKGVTLVEVMISLVILLIVFMGLIQASLLSMQSNMKNVLRDEAVRITSDRMARLRSIAFTDALLAETGNKTCATLADDTTFTTSVRNANVTFTIKKEVTSTTLDADHKRISLSTSWAWQGENFNCDNGNGVTMVATRGR